MQEGNMENLKDLGLFLPSFVVIITSFFLVKNVLLNLFKIGDYKLQKRRLKQLNKLNNNKSSKDIYDFAEKASKPIIDYILPVLDINIRQREEVKKKLDLVEAPINVDTYFALSFASKVLAIFFTVFNISSLGLAIASFIMFWFGPGFLLRNAYKNKLDSLFNSFPDFLRIIQANLSAGFTFKDSLYRSIDKLDDNWNKICKELYIDIDLNGESEALEKFKNNVDIKPVKEFVSIVKLTLEQGGTAEEAFNMQEENVVAMIQDRLEAIIEKRRVWTVVVQGPLMIAILLIFSLPIFGQMGQFLAFPT